MPLWSASFVEVRFRLLGNLGAVELRTNDGELSVICVFHVVDFADWWICFGGGH